MPRKAKNPTMSVMLVTKGPEETAGSTPSRLRVRGTKMPPSGAETSQGSTARPGAVGGEGHEDPAERREDQHGDQGEADHDAELPGLEPQGRQSPHDEG